MFYVKGFIKESIGFNYFCIRAEIKIMVFIWEVLEINKWGYVGEYFIVLCFLFVYSIFGMNIVGSVRNCVGG